LTSQFLGLSGRSLDGLQRSELSSSLSIELIGSALRFVRFQGSDLVNSDGETTPVLDCGCHMLLFWVAGAVMGADGAVQVRDLDAGAEVRAEVEWSQ
tara:strand:- start:167 stop:457 length:291 start_codon:yes stop_codon:yes gene_type:complete